MFPKQSPYYDKKVTDEIIQNIITRHFISYDNTVLVSPATEENAKISPNFLLKYNLVDKTDKTLNDFNINSFTQIGFHDPWPDDKYSISGSLDDIDP